MPILPGSALALDVFAILCDGRPGSRLAFGAQVFGALRLSFPEDFRDALAEDDRLSEERANWPSRAEMAFHHRRILNIRLSAIPLSEKVSIMLSDLEPSYFARGPADGIADPVGSFRSDGPIIILAASLRRMPDPDRQAILGALGCHPLSEPAPSNLFREDDPAALAQGLRFAESAMLSEIAGCPSRGAPRRL